MSSGKTLHKVLSTIPQGRRKLLLPLPKAIFFSKNYFPPKQGGGRDYEGSVKLIIASIIGSVNRFHCNKSKELPNSFLSCCCKNILRS